MLKKICRCGKVIPYSMKRCLECEEKAEEERKQYIKYYKKNTYERDSKSTKFYNSREWDIARSVAIARDHGLCQDCLKKDKIKAFNTVHHIIPIKEDWDKRLDINNLICVCESHHQIRENELRRRGYLKSLR